MAADLYLDTDDQVKMQGLIDIAQDYGFEYRVEYGASKTMK